MLKKITTLSMALLFPVIASAYTPKKEALLVGVSHYQNGDRLPGIRNDINQMRELLESRGFHVTVLFNKQATLSNVVNQLQTYRKLSSNDSFVFYDSSHGTQVPDENGDEKDGLDEAYVLYDANFNISNEHGLLIDDQLDTLLSKIDAKKVIISDTCHSGTIYKSFTRNAKTKSVKASSNFKYIHKDRVTGPISKVTNMVGFGAAADNEKSVATSYGSLFTEAFSDVWRTEPNITFKGMQKATRTHIKDICNNDQDLVAYRPTLYSTNPSYITQPMNEFLNINIKINPKPETKLVENYLDQLMQRGNVGTLALNAKTFYNKGERIVFNIDTLQQQGHLYILTVKESENEINVLYPNPYYQNRREQWRGVFNFPNAGTPFVFKASNHGRRLERTVVYTILSLSIIPELEVSRVGAKKFQSIFKNSNGQSHLKNAFKDILIKRKHNKISIAKHTFSVGV